jgi:hypothetical protein
LLLHAVNSRPQTTIATQRRKGAKKTAKKNLTLLCVSFAPLRLCVGKILTLILNRHSFAFFLRHCFTGHAILTLDPASEIDKLAPLRTERTEAIIFPFDWFTAGWALH